MPCYSTRHCSNAVKSCMCGRKGGTCSGLDRATASGNRSKSRALGKLQSDELGNFPSKTYHNHEQCYLAQCLHVCRQQVLTDIYITYSIPLGITSTPKLQPVLSASHLRRINVSLQRNEELQHSGTSTGKMEKVENR